MRPTKSSEPHRECTSVPQRECTSVYIRHRHSHIHSASNLGREAYLSILMNMKSEASARWRWPLRADANPQRKWPPQAICAGATPLMCLGQHTAWNKAVQMNMSAQVLPPGMQHRQHTQLAIQMIPRIGKLGQCLPNGFKQHLVKDVSMNTGPTVKQVRQREYHMMISHR